MNLNHLVARIPRTFVWRLRRQLKDGITLLDAGCGDGQLAALLSRPSQQIVGIDIDAEQIRQARALGTYSALVIGTLNRLPFKDQSFDLVYSCEAIEHLPKDEACRALAEFSRLARRAIVVTTPNGVGQEPVSAYRNPHMEHKSEWSPSELESYGYSVSGLGARWAWGPGGLARKPFPIGAVMALLSFFTTNLPGHNATTSAGLLAVLRQAHIPSSR